MLTKLSKGGFTANWNRRAFALIGSSLFYAKDLEALTARPKIFAEIAGCDVHSWSPSDSHSAPHQHVVAVSVPRSRDDAQAHERGHSLLLLAADSKDAKLEWIDAFLRGRHMPRCPLVRVAPEMALQMYGGCSDVTLDAVLQAPIP